MCQGIIVIGCRSLLLIICRFHTYLSFSFEDKRTKIHASINSIPFVHKHIHQYGNSVFCVLCVVFASKHSENECCTSTITTYEIQSNLKYSDINSTLIGNRHGNIA